MVGVRIIWFHGFICKRVERMFVFMYVSFHSKGVTKLLEKKLNIGVMLGA